MATTIPNNNNRWRGLRERVHRVNNQQSEGDHASNLPKQDGSPGDEGRVPAARRSRWKALRRIPKWLPRVVSRGWPDIEVRELGSSIVVIAEVPGFDRDQLDVEVTGSRVTIAGQRERPRRSRLERIAPFRYVRPRIAFSRALVLPASIETDHVSCDLRNGELTIVAQKKRDEPTRKVPIGSPRS